MIQWSPFNYNFPFFYVQNDNIISVNKVCIELLIETTKFRIFDVVSDFHFLQILFNILYFLVCNLNYNANERKVTKSSCYITFTSFLLCLNSFFSFLFHFILKRYVFIFAYTVVFWLEPDGVHRIVRPIYTRFSWHKKYFLFKHFYMKLYTQRKNFAAKDVILKCRMFHQCDTVQGMQNETAKNNIKQNTFGIYRY